MKTPIATAAILLALGSGCSAFVGPTPSTKVDTSLGSTGKLPFDIKDISYGEESRQYRRTVYSHDDWVKHRSPDRFLKNLVAITASGVYKNLAKEVLATTSVATLIVVWNCVFGGYTDFEGVQHAALYESPYLPVWTLPLAPFTLSSFALGLLLVFRTSTSYQRWDEARKNWGMNINHTRDLVRMASAFYDREGVPREVVQQDLQKVALATWSFVRSMKRHLSPESEDEQAFRKELMEKLPEKQAQAILKAAHRPNRALQDLSFAIEALPMHYIRKNDVQQAATIFEDNLGSSERLLSSPVPLFYSRHTARFLSVYLLLLPFGLWDTFGNSWNHAVMIPATAALSVFLFGIEELATQMEEPFTILPMQVFCDKIYNWLNEIISWEPNDNGMFDNSLGEDLLIAAAAEATVAARTGSNKATPVVAVEAIKQVELSPPAAAATPPAPSTATVEPTNGSAPEVKKRGWRRLFPKLKPST